MSIKIITDSASDIFQEEAKKLDITVLPLKTIFGTEEYFDGIDLTYEEFYNKLIESDELPKTSQVTPYEYEMAYKEALKENDEVICITISKYLSGCYQSAIMAKEEMNNSNIYVVDSENATIGERLLIELAIRLKDEGKSAKEIVDILEEKKKNIRLIALLDTLEYLKKGGRISSAVAFFGSLLSIKPVIEVDLGQVKMLGKARGSKNANNILRELVNKKGGIDFTMPYSLAYSGLSTDLLNKYVEDNQDLYKANTDNLPVSKIGSTIGTHVGPGAIAVAFFSKN